MSFCEQCGQKLSEGAKFCASCGRQIVIEEQQPVMSPIEEKVSSVKNATNQQQPANAMKIVLACVVIAVLAAGVYSMLPKKDQIPLIGTGWQMAKLISSNGDVDILEEGDRGLVVFLPDGRIAFGAPDNTFRTAPEPSEFLKNKVVPTSDRYMVEGGNRLILSSGNGKVFSFEFTISGNGEMALRFEDTNKKEDDKGKMILIPSAAPAVIEAEAEFEIADDKTIAEQIASANVAETLSQTLDVSSLRKCHSNLKQLGLVMHWYRQAHNDRWPAGQSSSFIDILQPYANKLEKKISSRELLECPHDKIAYSFNTNVENIDYDQITDPDRVILFYEGKNGILDYRHNIGDRKYANAVMIDGRIRGIHPDEADAFRWYP